MELIHNKKTGFCRFFCCPTATPEFVQLGHVRINFCGGYILFVAGGNGNPKRRQELHPDNSVLLELKKQKN
jgi:hypothetical protein